VYLATPQECTEHFESVVIISTTRRVRPDKSGGSRAGHAAVVAYGCRVRQPRLFPVTPIGIFEARKLTRLAQHADVARPLPLRNAYTASMLIGALDLRLHDCCYTA
jgi:hypothetical protein